MWSNGTAAKMGLAIDKLKRGMRASARLLELGKLCSEGRSINGYSKGEE